MLWHFSRILFVLGTALAIPVHENRDDGVLEKWIVQLRPGIDPNSIQQHHDAARAIHRRNSRREDDGIEKTYKIKDFNAYAGSFDQATAAEIASLPEVLKVTRDAVKYIAELGGPQMERRDLLIQESAPWALGSISHRKPGSTEYNYDSTAGQGTFAYVLDTGIRLTHVDFEGRASFGYNAAKGSNVPSVDHGTSVASFAVGKTYGVAKKANVIDVNVFGDSSSSTDSVILDGFNWAVEDIIAKGRVNASVINMSLAGARTPNSPWDDAIQNAFDLGVLVVVASGNENTNASSRSPASSPAAFTVGNINQNNTRHNQLPTFGSNYGPAVDIFAPGTAVTGASIVNDTAVRSTTGTSNASPHVAGLACYLRGLYGPISAEDTIKRILELATKDVVIDPKGSANLLAYNGSGR